MIIKKKVKKVQKNHKNQNIKQKIKKNILQLQLYYIFYTEKLFE